MINIPGQLAIKTIHGRNGDFNVGQLTTSIGKFFVKSAELDQYNEGKYGGDFAIAEIVLTRPYYSSNGGLVIEVRAVLSGMTLSNVDALSHDEAAQISLQEVDPVDEDVQVSAPVPPVPTSKAKVLDSEGPLVDTTPFGCEPPATSCDASAEADDRALFDSLWPLNDVVKLDATVDRRRLRQQRDRLGELGYDFDPLSQRWQLAAMA